MKNRTFVGALALALTLIMTTACAAPPPAPAAAPPAPAPAEAPADEEDEEPAEQEPAPAPFADFPTGTVTIYNSSTAGSPADVMARELARALENIHGVPFNVVNATGGGGGVMFGSVMRNPTDGYTWGSFTAAQIASLQAGLDRDFPIEMFDFVSNIQTDTFSIAVQYGAPWQTLEDLIEYAQAGTLQFGGQGTGSGMHLCALQLGHDGGFEFIWLPYDGGADSVRNLLGGHAQAIMTTPTTVRDYVEAGQIRMLAVTGDARLSAFPNVPIFSELGFPDVALTQYRGVFVQTGTDPELVVRISEMIREATLADTFVEYMNFVNMDDTFMDNVTFTEFVHEDFIRIGEMADRLLN
jgi:tripartite-type tricarboxylate transporter receptor subunit TctC